MNKLKEIFRRKPKKSEKPRSAASDKESKSFDELQIPSNEPHPKEIKTSGAAMMTNPDDGSSTADEMVSKSKMHSGSPLSSA